MAFSKYDKNGIILYFPGHFARFSDKFAPANDRIQSRS